MDAFLGNLTRINSAGKTFFPFEIFVTTPQIEKDDAASIMGTFTFLGFKLMTHDNDKSPNPIGGR